ncbi:hypothetical protein An14g02600 [Aspergillus niger]|uniref:Uncharacterized protein n=2 Tax=Aspergillus niger TaxID=5061 RepID=A2R306_ASPNC|nr:hypothetical protein An14g02600 [Aspergillus niger]CAK46508.1 hypothetical protein An14g02600 [Aspergillus niger]
MAPGIEMQQEVQHHAPRALTEPSADLAHEPLLAKVSKDRLQVMHTYVASLSIGCGTLIKSGLGPLGHPVPVPVFHSRVSIQGASSILRVKEHRHERSGAIRGVMAHNTWRARPLGSWAILTDLHTLFALSPQNVQLSILHVAY